MPPRAKQVLVGTEDGVNLLAGYKRAANILKKEGVEQAEAISLSYDPEKAEADLIAALDAAEPQAAQAVAAEEFEGAMAALATLRAPTRVTPPCREPALPEKALWPTARVPHLPGSPAHTQAAESDSRWASGRTSVGSRCRSTPA